MTSDESKSTYDIARSAIKLPIDWSGSEKDPVTIKYFDNESAKKVRIVHISDTHLKHDEYLPSIPDGDILIHSGDFSHFAISRFLTRSMDYHAEIQLINNFFAKLPHQHKIFVAGNHEMNFHQHSARRTHSLLTEVIYLQDSSVTIKGIKFYGSPWNGRRNSSYARGFTVSYNDLDKYWTLIPEDINVLITHQPPMDILDGGRHISSRKNPTYENPDDIYQYFYLGCKYLRKQVFERVKPQLHCFGHYHGGNGVIGVDESDTIFCNAAMKVNPQPKVIDFFVDPTKVMTDLTPQYYGKPESDNSRCAIS